MLSRFRLILSIGLLSLFIGCAAPTREDKDEFELINSGKIAPAQVAEFVDWFK